jgi:uncharacterized protein YkwD
MPRLADVSVMRRALAFLAAAVALWVLAPAASSAPQSSAVARRGPLERAVGRELNRIRVAHDLKPLRFGDGLSAAAAQHSRSMLESGYFEHASSDGTSFDARIKRFYGTRGWRSWAVGETLLSSSVEIPAREIVSTWLDSPPHREVILSATYRDGGVGVFYASSASGAFGNQSAFVVTADFGLRQR